jgi:DNA-binding SARP family transcriptional activator/tetratricopeptide (TPR) repeat protein
MESLEISTFGAFRIHGTDGKEIRFRSDRVVGLLSFLIGEADSLHNRENLLTLIWPETEASLARNNFRVALHRIRQAFERIAPQKKFIMTTTAAVQFNPDGDYRLDTNIFTKTITACQHAQNQSGYLDEAQLVLLAEAVEIYKGDFLSNVYLGSESFEEWLYAKRETFHQAAIWACNTLIQNHIRQQNWQSALAAAYRLTDLEPWLDAGHRQAMKLLVATGQSGAALRHFEAFAKALAEKMGVAPQPETQKLYQDLKNGKWRVESLNQDIPRSHFPTDFSPFVGREEDLAQINRWLQDPHCRLINLVGPGGVGKTRLATQTSIEISRNPKSAFTAGIYFVPLEDASSPDEFVSGIVKALDIAIVPGEALESALIKYLRKKKLLLVLDNFEHLLPMKDLIISILRTAPNVKIIITSREHLGLQAEWILSVTGLPFPRGDALENPESYAAVNLFKQSIKRIRPGFADAPALETEAIVEICRLVEGLPLALELAANWTPVLSVSEIASEIAQGIDIMRTTQQDVPARHRSIEAVFDYSWRLLPPEHQKLIEHLSLFPGEFDRPAAAKIAGASLPGLASLARKSFLYRSTETGKYHIHPLLKQFARKKADHQTNQENRLIRRRYSQYYLGRIIGQKDDLILHDNWPIIKKYRTELPHLRQAWKWALDHEVFEAIDQSTTAIAVIYFHLGLYADGFALMEMAIVRLRAVIRENGQAGLDFKRMLGRLLVEAAGFRIDLYELEQAEALLREAGGLGQETNDFYIQTRSDYLSATVQFCYRNFSGAMAHVEQVGKITNTPALIATDAERALIQRLVHYTIGQFSLLSGNYPVAEQNLVEAVRLFGLHKNALRQGYSLLKLSELYLRQFRFDLAHQKITEAQAIFANSQYPGGQAHLSFVRGKLFVALGAWERSRDYFYEFINISDNARGYLNYLLYHYYLGMVMVGQNNLPQAQQYFERGVHKARAMRHTLEEADSMYGLGLVAEKNSELTKAAKHYRAALALKKQLDLHIPPLEPLAGLARLALFEENAEKIEKGLGYVEEILAWLEPHPSLEGITSPAEIYLTCYQVLNTVGDPRAAKLLAQGKEILRKMACRISDKFLRIEFLSIEANQKISTTGKRKN